MYLWLVTLVAVGLLTYWLQAWHGPVPADLRVVALFVVLAVIAQHFPLPLGANRKPDASIAAYFAFLLLFGAAPAVALVGASQLLGQSTLALRRSPISGTRRRTLRSILFNTSQFMIATALSALVYYSALPHVAPAPLDRVENLWLLPAAAVTMYLANTLAVVVMVGLQQRVSVAEVWFSRHSRGTLQYAGLLVIALVTARAAARDPWITMVMILPAAIVYLSLKRTEQLSERAALLKESEARFRRLAENAQDIICRFELQPQRAATYVSPAAQRMLGYTPEEFYADPDLPFKVAHPEDRSALEDALRGQGLSAVAPQVTMRLCHKAGHIVWVDLRLIAVLNEASVVTAWEGIARDISERKALEEDLVHQAAHDALTNLSNRASFVESLGRALARAARQKGTVVAVLFLDLDRFKVINDSLGHEVGDRLLVAMSERLQSSIRAGDIAARLGGDEFTVLLENVIGVGDAIEVADRITKALQVPITLSEQEVFITTSIGIALSSSVEGLRSYKEQAEDLLRNADVAMYRAKSKGKARHEVFRPSMQARALDRLKLETDLRRGLERQEFVVHYQPTLLLESGRIVGAEALIRWEHPTQGLVTPLEFIPLAEETGVIIPMGHWVLEEACRQAHAWHAEYPSHPPLTICVNLSAREFQQPQLREKVARVLDESGLDPRSLMLEITETSAMEDAESTIIVLRELKSLGVQLAIDDFGTGYASLNYLKMFPVDHLKIDRSFIAGLGQDAEGTAIVSAIVRLAQALGLQVTAEGVETAEQVAHLRRLGCDVVQGYYFAKPLACEAAAALLDQQTTT